MKTVNQYCNKYIIFITFLQLVNILSFHRLILLLMYIVSIMY